MASKKHVPAKILKKGKKLTEVKKTKKSKTVVKTTLENPFSVDWPIINEELEEEILSELESCCHGLKIPICKPPWNNIRKLRGEERMKYCQEYKKNVLENLLTDPDAASKYEMAKEARSHLIFGYNAVMRALEQNRLAGILLRKDVEPSFLAQTFLPGCVNKCIPLVPLLGLDSILKSEETLGVQHGVMVLGLKPSVKETSCRFYPLYVKLTKVLQGMEHLCKTFEVKHTIQSTEVVVNDNKENSEPNPNSTEIIANSTDSTDIFFTSSKENNEETHGSTEILVNIDQEQDLNGTEYKLNEEEIQSYHLKRTDKSQRVFIPKKKTKVVEVEFGGDFLEVEPMKGEIPFSKLEQKSGDKINKRREAGKGKEIITNPEKVGHCFDFFIDTSGMEGMKVTKENATNKEVEVPMAQQIQGKGGKIKKKSLKTIGNKRSLKKKLPGTYLYVSAKTKRIKSNPNRKANKKKQ